MQRVAVNIVVTQSFTVKYIRVLKNEKMYLMSLLLVEFSPF